jgi:two-component system OmpR family response regulator
MQPDLVASCGPGRSRNKASIEGRREGRLLMVRYVRDVMKVFIVEDSGIVQEILVEELVRIKGVQVCGIAQDPNEAVRSIREKNPDLVILDLVLSNGNGFEVLKRIREDGIEARVIVLTNYSFLHYKKICREMGADLFYDKSVELDKAFQAVRTLAGSG